MGQAIQSRPLKAEQAKRANIRRTWPHIPTPILLAWLVLGFFAATSIFSLLGYQIYFLDRVHTGVSVNGVDVSTYTRPELEQLVNQQTQAMLGRQLTLESEVGTWTFTAAELGARVDEAETVNLAYSVGRRGDFWLDLVEQVRVWEHALPIASVIRFDSGPANNALANIATQLNRPAMDAQLFIDEQLNVVAIPAQMGRQLNIEASREAIRQALLTKHQAPVQLYLEQQTPRITEVAQTQQVLTTLLSQPLVFQFVEENRQWSLSPAQLAEVIFIGTVQGQEGAGQVVASFNQPALQRFFEGLAAEIAQEKSPARFQVDPATLALTPLTESQNGYQLDVETAVAMTLDLLHTPHNALPLPVWVDMPAASSADPSRLGVTGLMHSATSYFKGSSAARMENIKVSAEKFHGLVIAPGEIFSFNEHLGPVTAENGFVEGLIIAGDRTAVGIGGGVCQVSTTVFRAALFGGFEIVERWAHGYRVGWYETNSGPGLDATIYSPYVDFKFRNDTTSHIVVQTTTDLVAGTITFDFYGQPQNRVVEVSEPLTTKVIPHGEAVYEVDERLAPGEVEQVEWAKDGQDVTVTRRVYEDGQLLHSDTIFSRYRPWAARYKIGPQPE